MGKIKFESIFRGVTTPVPELIRQIEDQAWEVGSVAWSGNAYKAKATNAHGDTLERTGPDAGTAMANLLIAVTRRNYMRTKAHVKISMWQDMSHWHDVQAVATAYSEAPVYDPQAVGAFKELADDSVRRAAVLGEQLDIEIVDDPEPYASPQEMCDDIHEKKHFYVSRANSEHPVWTTDQNVAFRIVHDVLGHCVSGGSFDFAGELRACAAHFPLLSTEAQKALATECIGQTAYAAFYRQFGPQKVAFLDEFIEAAQTANNAAAHQGVHPSQILAPTKAPAIPEPEYDKYGLPKGTTPPHETQLGMTPLPPASLDQLNYTPTYSRKLALVTVGSEVNLDEVEGWTPGNFGKFIVTPEGQLHHWKNEPNEAGGYDGQPSHFAYATGHPELDVDHYGEDMWSDAPQYTSGWIDRDGNMDSLNDSVHRNEHMKLVSERVPGIKPYEEGAWAFSKVAAGEPIDPNWGYQTGIDPHPEYHAQLHYGDPLEHDAVRETAAKIDTGWSQMDPNDPGQRALMKQAIVNAFRVVLLSPRKDLRWNAVHYQDISHIPAEVDDPKVYWDALEEKRKGHNVARGRHPEAHLVYYKPRLKYYQMVQMMNPDLTHDQAIAKADDVIFKLRLHETEKIEREDATKPPEKQRSADEVERRVNEAIAKKLKQLTDHKPKAETDVAENQGGQMALAKTAMPYVPEGFTKVAPGDYETADGKIRLWQLVDVHPPAWNMEDVETGEILVDGAATVRDALALYQQQTPKTADVYPAPDRKHQPNWQPGTPGKGIIFRNGAVHTWNTSESGPQGEYERGDGYPFHVDYIMAELNDQPPEKPEQFFHISPEGTYTASPQYQEHIQEAHPDLKPGDSDWRFGAAGQQDIFTGEGAEFYGAWMGSHLKAIAEISRHSDELLDTAIQDVQEHDGTGHHFRAKVLQLGISGCGPKVASFAWLLLQPMTSQLATIDTHMMDVLGHNYEKRMNNRDYFLYERQLQAGRDAAGYGHVPLGQFQWGMWDLKRTGQGSHQDHSAMRVLDPVPHDSIDWASKAQNLKAEDWAKQAPEWWQVTQPARDQIEEDWKSGLGGSVPKNSIPFQTLSRVADAPGEFGTHPFSYWWDKEKPIQLKDARKIADYAAATKMTKARLGAYIESHKDDVKGILSEFKKKVLERFEKSHRSSRTSDFNPTPVIYDNGRILIGPPGGEHHECPGSETIDPYRATFGLIHDGDQIEWFSGDPGGATLALEKEYGRPLRQYEEQAFYHGRTATAFSQSIPWHTDQSTGSKIQGEPGRSLMRHLRDHHGLSTEEIWDLDPEVGKEHAPELQGVSAPA